MFIFYQTGIESVLYRVSIKFLSVNQTCAYNFGCVQPKLLKHEDVTPCSLVEGAGVLEYHTASTFRVVYRVTFSI